MTLRLVILQNQLRVWLRFVVTDRSRALVLSLLDTL